ncbi:MAG: adenosylmethionine--8-amino-7-oxononanoate transaminase [Burkholderiales bacterium PBB1]|nr:MAG: adenosylmethionine--8-amino-7-oxononanoate transaminase [Burkholderiales bacterium PBB1]
MTTSSNSPSASSVHAAWQQRSAASVWHPCTQMKRLGEAPPLAIARAQGPWLEDVDGLRYFDATSSWWVNLFGHADARINAALKHQLDTLEHVMLAGCTHAPAVELAERLSARTGHALGHTFFASDGASAVEIALKMSFHSWKNRGLGDKREFVCLRHGYHGETIGALAVTDVAVFRDAYDPLLMRAHVVMAPDARQAAPGESAAEVAQRAVAELAMLLESRAGQVAALIIEPLVQCAAGMAMHDAAYLREVRALCDRHQVHLIADEIAVGCGRTGTFFAFEQASPEGGPTIWPDLLCLSKGISGGYLPLSLVLATDAIYEAFLDDDTARGFLHSHSYTGNPLACRAALAVLDRFDDEPVLQRNRETGALLTTALAARLEGDARIEHVRQRGMIWAFDVREAHAGVRFAERFHLAGRARGLLIRPIGRTVYLMPPYVLNDEHVAYLSERVVATLHAVL